MKYFVRSKKTSLCEFFVFVKLQNMKRKVFVSDVLYLFHLTTSGSKKFCGLTLLRRKKNFQPLLVCRCVSLLLGGEESVFLDAWCVRTSLRIGWQTISGERC